MPAALPTTIGRFKVESLLGSGGMGDVYKCTDMTLHRTVAVKTVRGDIDNPAYLDRLYREAQAIARLQHPHIVTVFEAGESDGLVYIAMEFLKGENLSAALDRGELNFETKIKIVMQILDALQYAHSEGVIHRDIKPANVHRLPDGSIKLLDFGLARMTRTETLTVTGAIMGTPFYASPEQLRGEPIDPRTDIYSTGVMAYEMVTGRRAFDGENLSTVMLKVLQSPPPPMETSWSNTFPEIERIITRAMAKMPADRYATAEDMSNALAAFLSSAREGLATVQAEQTFYAQRAVQEARTLIARGEVAQAKELLESTLKSNPDAAGARSLLKDTTSGGARKIEPPLIPQSEPTMAVPEPEPTIVRPGGGRTAKEPPIAEPWGIQPPPKDESPKESPSPLFPPSPTPRKGEDVRAGDSAAPGLFQRPVTWAVTAVAVAIVAVVVWMVTRPGASTPPNSTEVASSIPSPAGEPPPSPGPAPTSTPESSAASPSPATAPPSTAASNPPAAPPAGKEAAAPVAPVKSPPPPKDAKAEPPPPVPGPAKTKEPAASPAGAKRLFVENASKNPGLRYAIVQQLANGAEGEVDVSATFHSGDRIRFTFESNIDGYLYLVQEGSSGKWAVLFPNPQINGGLNKVQRGQKISVPSGGWFRLDNNVGTDRAFVILSKEPLSQLPGFNEPVTKIESLSAPAVAELRNTVKSRDLVFEKEPAAAGAPPSPLKSQSNFVVNKSELGQSVSATIELIHQP